MTHRPLAVVLLLAVAPFAGCAEDAVVPSVASDYRYDDGPWLTPGADAARTLHVTWLTRDEAATRLWLGRSPQALSEVALEVDPDARRRLHQVVLDGLEPDTVYYYDVPLDDVPGARPLSFRTLPQAPRRLRFGVVGDMQPDRPELVESVGYMAEAIAGVEVDFWVQLGDIVHDGGELEEWHMLLDSLPAFAARTPLFATLGNHDTWGDEGANWTRLFPHPFVGRGRYYSADVLDVHLVVIDNFDGDWTRPSEAQLAWLEADLAAARAAGKWIFAFMHLSLVSTGSENMDFAQQQALVPLFHRYAVDAVFYGHDHMYEHYLYTYGESGLFHDPADVADPRTAVHYFLSGGGGAELESGYGILERPIETVERTWYDATRNAFVSVPVTLGPWNAQRFVDGLDPAFAPNGRNYTHDCAIECYQSDAMMYGHDHGENTLHYLIVEIEGDTATVATYYPDGTLVMGVDGTRPQHFTLQHRGLAP